MDKIYIRDLAVNTIIGTLPEERKKKQKLIFNIEIVAGSNQSQNIPGFRIQRHQGAVVGSVSLFVKVAAIISNSGNHGRKCSAFAACIIFVNQARTA